jgi:hypothetical protein
MTVTGKPAANLLGCLNCEPWEADGTIAVLRIISSAAIFFLSFSLTIRRIHFTISISITADTGC